MAGGASNTREALDKPIAKMTARLFDEDADQIARSRSSAQLGQLSGTAGPAGVVVAWSQSNGLPD
jgi:hypothetical protein